MDNKTFNDYMIEWAAQRMVAQNYANSVDEAKTWLVNRRREPMFQPANNSFAARGATATLNRLCEHVYDIVVARRNGQEVELPSRVKAYYLPRFQASVEAK